MKKISRTIIVAVSLLFALQSCESQKVVVNREVDSKNDGKMLLGTQTKSQLQKAPYSDWFDQEYKDYVMDDASIKDLRKEKFSTYNLTVFLGTWCEDSHREVPTDENFGHPQFPGKQTHHYCRKSKKRITKW